MSDKAQTSACRRPTSDLPMLYHILHDADGLFDGFVIYGKPI